MNVTYHVDVIIFYLLQEALGSKSGKSIVKNFEEFGFFNLKTKRNASKFAMFMEKENPRSFFSFFI